MLFNKCESCSNVGTCACECENPIRFFCDSHVSSHIAFGGKHAIEPALEGLTPSEVSSIEKAYKDHQLSLVRRVIEIRNSQIEKLLQQIRKAEEECTAFIKAILSNPLARDFQQIISYRALPLFSDSRFVHSLYRLKDYSGFCREEILNLLNSLNSSLLSSSFFSSSSQTSSTQTYYSYTASEEASISSQEASTQTSDPISYQWKLSRSIHPHGNEITSVAVSEDERYLATANKDNTIRIFTLENLLQLRTLRGHTNWVTSVSFLDDKVVSGSFDRTIKIWKYENCKKTLNLHSGLLAAVNSVKVSSCKRLIVSGSDDKTAVVYNLETDKTLHRLKHPDYVLSVAFSPNDKQIVSGSGIFNGTEGKGEMRVWKTETGELLKTLNPHSGTVTSIKFSGNFIVSSSLDRTVKVWDIDTVLKSWFWNKNEPFHIFSDHTQAVVNADAIDNILVSLGQDDKIIVRDIRSAVVVQTLRAHGTYDTKKGNFKMGLKVLEGGRFIVSGGVDGKINLWERIG